MLQLHDVHILHAAATRMLQWIHVQQNLSSIAAVDVVAALKHRTQIASHCVPQHGVHNMMLIQAKLSLTVSARQRSPISCMLWLLQSWGMSLW